MNDAKNKQKKEVPVDHLGTKSCSKVWCPFADIEDENQPESCPCHCSGTSERELTPSLEQEEQANVAPSIQMENITPEVPIPNKNLNGNLPEPGTDTNSLIAEKGTTENHYPNTTYNIRANQYSICMDSKTIRIDEYNFCKKKIRELSLPMRLIQTSYLEEDKRLVFFFTAPERVDFRELLRALRQQYFGIRIELRQIGQRDAASLLGGVGICGYELCCCSFLRSFSPITAKIAKKVGPTPNPAMYCGLCGRLRCCLRYEECDSNNGNEEETEPDWKFFEDQ